MINDNIRNEIITAIRLKKPFIFYYQGYKDRLPKKRIGNPHAVYYHTDTNNLIVDIFQTGGESNSRRPPFWSGFLVENISEIQMFSNEEFIVSPDYNEYSEQYRKYIEKIHR